MIKGLRKPNANASYCTYAEVRWVSAGVKAHSAVTTAMIFDYSGQPQSDLCVLIHRSGIFVGFDISFQSWLR